MSAHEYSLKDLQQRTNWHFLQYSLYGACAMKCKLCVSMEKNTKNFPSLRSSIIKAWHVYSTNLYTRPPFLNMLQYKKQCPVSYVHYRFQTYFDSAGSVLFIQAQTVLEKNVQTGTVPNTEQSTLLSSILNSSCSSPSIADSRPDRNHFFLYPLV